MLVDCVTVQSEGKQVRACQTALPSDVPAPESRNSRVIGRGVGTPPPRSLASSVRILYPTELLGRSQITWNTTVGDSPPTRGQGSAGHPGRLPAGCGDTSWRRLPLRSARRSGCPSRTCHAERRWRASLMPSILESAGPWHASLNRDGVSAESGDSAVDLQHLIEIGLVAEVAVPLARVRGECAC